MIQFVPETPELILRLVHDLGHIVDKACRDTVCLTAMHDVVFAMRLQPGSQVLVEGGAMLRARERRGKARIVQQLRQAGQGQQALVLLLLAHRQGDETILAGIDRNRVGSLIAVADALLNAADVDVAVDSELVDGGHTLLDGDVHVLSLSALLPCYDRCHRSTIAVQAALVGGLPTAPGQGLPLRVAIEVHITSQRV